ncbi:hypothetical protein MKA54_00595 [[Clostridium] innocuum]|nr:hypothetical protein [[Clostridium] innocuum]
MLDEHERFLLHQIRILIKQLEERQETPGYDQSGEKSDDRFQILLKLS